MVAQSLYLRPCIWVSASVAAGTGTVATEATAPGPCEGDEEDGRATAAPDAPRGWTPIGAFAQLAELDTHADADTGEAAAAALGKAPLATTTCLDSSMRAESMGWRRRRTRLCRSR